KCLATLYCEYCVRNYLKAQFSNWTSENDNIDNLIRECQMETLKPDNIIEWIPYNNLKSIDYLKKQLIRIGGNPDVVLKKLENVEKANKNWIDEAKSYLNICNPSDGNYMLVMNKSHMNLREYLKRKHNEITWIERINITDDIIFALSRIHKKRVSHKNLHSGNVLFNQRNKQFYITDLGFRGPADRPSNSIYGNLPYIAPEIIAGKEITFASDIYSIGILMWEISFGKPPFIYQEDELFLAMNIINGIGPKIESGIPLEYKKLMMQCWDADPKRRPNLGELYNKIFEMRIHCQNLSNDSNIFKQRTNNILEISETSNLYETDYKLFTSKVYVFEDFPEPRNGTEVDDNIVKMMQSSSIFKGSSKVPQIYSNEDIQVDYKRETIQQTKNVDIKDEHELYSNPNLHSEDQDELEIPWIV
ncbi:kinase-like domain-containing protein, partial [Rhizophagus diaphanus]